MTVADDSIIKSFMELGLSEQKAKETLKNAAVTKILQEILHEVRLYILEICCKVTIIFYRVELLCCQKERECCFTT